MSLPSLSVKRPTMISMFYIGVVLFGIVSFRLLPVEMMPNTSFGDITINIDVRGGIPASEVEKRISRPVEEAVSSVSNLKNILSISKEGNATIILEFEPGINMDFASLEVREKFNRIKNKLPPEIEKPVIAKYEYMDVPIIILAVTSNIRTPEDLGKIVEDRIKERIQRIEGVARAEVAGFREGRILIEVDQRKLQAFSLPINRLVDIININNANLLAGEIKRTKDKYLIRTIGEFQNLADIENLAIAVTKEGSVIRVKDVATVKDSFLEANELARLNAQPVVSIYIQKESTANTVKISKAVKKEIQNLKSLLEKDIQINIISDQAEAIEQAISQVKLSLLIGAFLATFILIIFLRDLRSVFIIASSIPLSVLITFCLMWASHITINVMTLSGLALGVGMLVDNAIVVLDNTYKKHEESRYHQEAYLNKKLAIEAAEEMSLAISASTLTTIIVFFPLVFINPEIRMLYSGIALTITYSLVASLLTALTLVPMLASRMKMRQMPMPGSETQSRQVMVSLWSRVIDIAKGLTTTTPLPPEGGDATKTTAAQETPTPAPVTAVENAQPSPEETLALPWEPLLSQGQAWYRRLIAKSLTLRYLIVLVASAACLLVWRESTKLEKEFIGIAEQNKFTIFVELPTGTRLEVSDKIVYQLEQIVTKLPEVKNVTSKIEPWSSKIHVDLHPLNKRKIDTAQVIEKLRPVATKFEPAFIYFEEPEEVGTKEILVELYGYDYEVLKNLAIQAAQRIQTIPKFTDTKIRMREGRPEMRLNINKREAALFGLSVEEIALALHTHMRGLVATRYRGTNEPLIRGKEETLTNRPQQPFPEEQKILQQKTQDVNTIKPPQPSGAGEESKEVESIVRLQEHYRRTFDDLRRISLVTPDGEQVYLSQVANFKFDLGPSEIWRKNKQRMVQVSANTGGTALGTAADKVKEVLKDLKFPKDYFWQFGGNYDKMVRTEKEFAFALTWPPSATVLSLVLVYILLACLFESFSQPIIIMITVPLAAIGAIIALRITHKPVGTGVLIGAIMLAGIVVNNAIVLVDRINFLSHRRAPDGNVGAAIRQVVIAASGDRLRPIMMTSLTTILGLIPMALDKSESSNLWSPLAITVIGGMSVSTFLTLFIIPCVYLMFKDLRLIRK